MSASVVIRPGLRMGKRPERRHAREIDRIDLAWERWFSHRVNPQLQTFKKFSVYLRDIEAAENHFSQLDLAKRNGVLFEMRESLRDAKRSHLELANVFALIRCGMQQTLGVRLYDEQLYAGWCLQDGHFIEMQTGEGKTLTAALPAISMALAGVPVHVITSNEYLAQRDLELLEPLYDWFGLKSGVVLSSQDDAQRHRGYTNDITYVTHQQLVFDYLRDTRLLGNQRTGLTSQIHELLQEDAPAALQRGLCFAIVDEADSVLIDDARTPLILAEPVEGNDGAGAEAAVALAIARTLNINEHFTVDNRTRKVTLDKSGFISIEQQVAHLVGIWKLTRYRDERIVQALSALHLYHKDIDYLVIDDAVVLIDQSTGRPMPQRRLQHGLHRIIEVKERCEISDETAAVSALSFQSFFSRYHKLCGMSGTLFESRNELRRVYGPRTLTIPTVYPCQRVSLPQVIHRTRDDQLSDMLEQVIALLQSQRALLIGTRTVSLSEQVSDVLTQAGIAHEVLNARQDADEAQTVAQAGKAKCVTVATNMAGRGTDIRCSATVIENGGLHVMNLELNNSARIDRQLHGRAARQGEPGSYQDILCLDDDLLMRELNVINFAFLSWATQYPRSAFLRFFSGLVIRSAQRKVESRDWQLRLAVCNGQTRLQKILAIGGYGE